MVEDRDAIRRDGGHRLTRVRENVAQRTDSVLASVKDAAERVAATARETARDASSAVDEEVAAAMAERARRGMSDGIRIARDNPLVLTVGALAAGCLVGAMLPRDADR